MSLCQERTCSSCRLCCSCSHWLGCGRYIGTVTLVVTQIRITTVPALGVTRHLTRLTHLGQQRGSLNIIILYDRSIFFQNYSEYRNNQIKTTTSQ